MRGLLQAARGRIYFSDEASNGEDGILALVPAERRHTLVAQAQGGGLYRWDVHMQGPHETVFFPIDHGALDAPSGHSTPAFGGRVLWPPMMDCTDESLPNAAGRSVRRPAVDAAFTDEARLQAMLDVERALARAQVRCG